MKRTLVIAALLAVVSIVGPPVEGAPADPLAPVTDGPVVDTPRFKEVGRVPITTAPFGRGTNVYPKRSGWIVINPGSRRGYTVVEGAAASADFNPAATFIQSFDLDTLRPLRQAVVPGIPVVTGPDTGGASGQAEFTGDFVHAVDPVAKRLYLPLSAGLNPSLTGTNPDAQRPVSYFLVLDEEAFDRDPARAFGSFTFPAGQQRLQAYHLMGMTVTRRHVEADEPGKLLAVFASPVPTPTVGYTTPALVLPAVYDHNLVQWDAGSVPTGQAPPTSAFVPGALPVVDDWGAPQVLTACATSSLTPNGLGYVTSKQFQWGILATRSAVYLGCQSAPASGAVVRVTVDPATGRPLATGPAVELQRLAPLGEPIGDVLVDDGGGRLLVRSFGGGSTWWVFDATRMRFVGSAAGYPSSDVTMAAGVDPASGRFYTLTVDTCAPRAGGGELPVRGGLKIVDTRLDPVPAAENVVPDLSYNSVWRIGVDPVRHRVFVRRGNETDLQRLRYPSCDVNKQQPAPGELFFRVYEDRIPPVEPPGDLDDSTLTTDVDEAKGVTEASYLGSGSGFGARALLVGGADAPTKGAPTRAQSLCGREDRDVLAGSVGKVEVSDVTVAAEAAALDANSRTQEVLGDPFTRCRPQAPYNDIADRNSGELNECHENVDVREGAFDQARSGQDDNGDGCDDRDGENRYVARCLGSERGDNPGFDDGDEMPPGHVAPRDGFRATTDCRADDERASATASGALSSELLDGVAPDWRVRVARSSSTVEVVRKAGKGVTVKVDSIARGIEIAGVGTIGVVRAEATSTSTGRDGGADTSFTRTICDVDVQGLVVSGCLSEVSQQTLVAQLNEVLGGYGEVRLRRPDADLAEGTDHGYLAAVQRDRQELFADQVISRDGSLAVPALEIVFFQGDGGDWGVGRQLFQLAAVQASTSYGIACTYGKKVDGSCAGEGEATAPPGFFDTDPPANPGDPITTTITETLPGETAVGAIGTPRESLVTRLLRALPRAVAEAIRLLFNNPRELGLLAALWALLYAPCYLGDRRRAVRNVAARRLTAPA